VDWGTRVLTFVAGQATGLAIALLIAWVERRWRRQDVRDAEKRVRLEERFESVRRYAIGLHEFVHEAVGLTAVGERSWRDEAWGTSAEALERELTQRGRGADWLRPRRGPAYLLRGAV
jgi:hypothetical protein